MKKAILISVAAAMAGCALANNPIVTTLYTADPAPMVYGDRIYVYIDRDEGNLSDSNDPNKTWFNMNEWRVYSSADMVNWTDHGAALPLSTFSWSEPGTAWASQCIERDGKFYWYVCCHPTGTGVPVLVLPGRQKYTRSKACTCKAPTIYPPASTSSMAKNSISPAAYYLIHKAANSN